VARIFFFKFSGFHLFLLLLFTVSSFITLLLSPPFSPLRTLNLFFQPFLRRPSFPPTPLAATFPLRETRRPPAPGARFHFSGSFSNFVLPLILFSSPLPVVSPGCDGIPVRPPALFVFPIFSFSVDDSPPLRNGPSPVEDEYLLQVILPRFFPLSFFHELIVPLLFLERGLRAPRRPLPADTVFL